MTDLFCDVAIIGAGTAGLAAERSAHHAGARTLLIDDRFAGTTCADVGCMPSKLLIAAGNAAHAANNAAVFGLRITKVEVDGAAVMARLRQQRDAFVAATISSIDGLPDGIKIRARAHFIDQTTLGLDDGRRISAKAVIIATGSRPLVPEPFQSLGDLVLTNETVFELPDLPRSLAVIGAGPLGLELAQAMARLGVDVEVFDEGHRLGGLHDETVAAELGEILAREMPLRLGVSVTAGRSDGGVTLTWTGASSGSRTFARVLVAAGRPPQLADLNLMATSLARNKKGTPICDPSTLQCGKAPIFMAGDADAERPVLHEASAEGAIAGRNAARFPDVVPGKRSVSISVMFTDPPVAVLGQPAGNDGLVGSASYADQGRAKVEARNVGVIRIYAARSDGRLTGATLAAPAMDHVAHLLAWAIERGETASSLLDLPIYHPTFEEGLKPALRAICKSTDTSEATDRDDVSPPGG
jgi:dihydrolipoamide dehydrogenase